MARFATLLVGGLNLMLLGCALFLLRMRQPTPAVWGAIAAMAAGASTLVALRPRSSRLVKIVSAVLAVAAHAVVLSIGILVICEAAGEQAQGDIVGGWATWLLPGLIVAIPVFSVGCLLGRGLLRLRRRPALALLLAAPPIAVAWFASRLATYLLAAQIYEGLLANPPPTQADLDSRLAAFAHRTQIFDLETSWARHRALKPGEEIARYLVLGVEPIDAVVGADGRVFAIYSSFE